MNVESSSSSSMQLLIRDPRLSLRHGCAIGTRRRPPSPLYNLAFGSSIFQQRSLLLPLPHNKSTSVAIKRASPVLQTVAVYSGDKDYVAESPAKALRRILDSPGIHQGPACFDALSAKLVERAGFQFCFTSGM